ncbi:MAG: HAD family hydrolase [Bacteroidetes bacterium]|nr:HAD family hydrolase [Bacteroidota bacterium]
MIQAITIDFWNTVVDSRNGDRRRSARNLAMRAVFDRVGRAWDEEKVTAAMAHAYETFERLWHTEQRTMRAEESLEVVWSYLGIELPDDMRAEIISRIEDSILEGVPDLLPGCGDALRKLSTRVPLALISDTAYSPGRVLRRVLQAHDVERYFSTLVFSDETGVSKPHPLMFRRALEETGAKSEHAVHIGDIERTDIAGASAMGMRSILFRGDESGRYHADSHPDQTEADAVAHSWVEVLHILEEWGLE